MKKIIAALSVMVLFLTNSALAANKTFIKEYTYLASDLDSKVSSRAIALEQVKRALLEELGTYLISDTEVKNFPNDQGPDHNADSRNRKRRSHC